MLSVDSRLIASIASRVEARPFVEHLFDMMASGGVSLPGCRTRFTTALEADIRNLLVGQSVETCVAVTSVKSNDRCLRRGAMRVAAYPKDLGYTFFAAD